MKPFNIVGLFLLIVMQIQAQPTPLIIRRLLEEKKEIGLITVSSTSKQSPLIIPMGVTGLTIQDPLQTLYKTKNHLYVGIKGTGYLYEITNLSDQMHFNRIDSTAYIGYNFSDLRFVMNNILYSFGGYGFWKSNGLLRYYNPTLHQWDMKVLNRELSTVFSENKSLVQLDSVYHRIGFANPSIVNDGVSFAEENLENNKYTVWILDLKAQTWTKAGYDFSKESLNCLGTSPWGVIAYSNGQKSLILIDLFSNQYFY